RGQMNSRMTWTDARNRCASLNGAHLATITSEEEQAFVESFATTGPGGTGDLWIGLWREGAATATNKFAWITDEPVNYVNWNTNEPNENGTACVRLRADNKRWSD